MLAGSKLKLVDLINIEDDFVNLFINQEFKHVGPLEEEAGIGFYGSFDNEAWNRLLDNL